VRAILISVNFSDLLSLTLPRNRHHFSDVCIVTTSEDKATHEVARGNNATVFTTDAFTRGGAPFRKWLALEEGLDHFGRHGLLTIMDSDIIWPHDLQGWTVKPGQLSTPLRRLMLNTTLPVPPESDWDMLPIARNQGEWAGYSQTFFCEDPALGPPPWYETDWLHCGGADSFFQRKWAPENKVRPPWHCLHVGRPGENWAGRVSRFTDGSTPPEAQERSAKLQEYMNERSRKRGLSEQERFSHERLK
jgi:hypothetical protein